MAPLPVDLAVGLAFLGGGTVAWRRRPQNRTGMLMVLAALAWFGRDFARSDADLPTRIGELSLNLFLALIAHQVIVFPYGVTRTRLERVLVRAAYSLAVAGYVISEIFPSTNETLAALAIPLLLAVVFVVVQRWLAATPPERRVLEPILWAGPPVLVVAALSVAHDYLDLAGSSAVDWLKLVYTAVPLAFLAGILRTQLHRAGVGDLVVEVGESGTPAAVREALARMLGDPSLQLLFRLPDGRYVDEDGRPAGLDDDRASTILDDVILVHDAAFLQSPELVRSTVAVGRLALERIRLQAQLRAEIERRSEADTAPTKQNGLAGLTTRELEVLTLVAEGRTDRGIAKALYITPKTVEAHVRSIFRKLDLPADSTLENRRVHAVLAFLRSQA